MVEKIIQATILSLGYLEHGEYCAEPDCLDGIRDLIRYLHGDDPGMTVRRICTGRNIVKYDLVPLLHSSKTSEELFDATLRLTINLCQPTLMVLGGKLPSDNEAWQVFYDAEANLVRTFSAFAHPAVFKVFAKHIDTFYAHEWEERSERERVLVERLLVLIRYVFAMGVEGGRLPTVPELDASVNEKVVECFFKSGIPEVFLQLLRNPMDRDFFPHVLSILALVLQRFSPKALVIDEATREQEQLQEADRELLGAIQSQRQEEGRVRQMSRRSFLQGSFVVKGVVPLNQENEFVVRRSLVMNETNPVEKLSQRKHARRTPKNRRVKSLGQTPTNAAMRCSSSSDAELQVTVGDYCEKLLNQGYDKLIRVVKDMAFMVNRSSAHQSIEVQYFSFVAFMTEFARLKGCPCELLQLSSTFSIEGFHHVVSYLDGIFERMKVDKEQLNAYLLKAQHAVSAYKEMVITLNSVADSERLDDKDLFRRLCDQVFKIEEYRELGCSIITHMKPGNATKKMLQDLVLINHYYVHVMEKVLKSGRLDRVRKERRKRVRRGAKLDGTKRKRLYGEEDKENSPVMEDAEPTEDVELALGASATSPLRAEPDGHQSSTGDEGAEDDYPDAFEDEVVEMRAVLNDVPFDFDAYVMEFAKRDVVAWYIHVLREFESNPPEVNKAILKMFHRIAFDLKSPSRLYLATLFRVFKSIEMQVRKWPEARRPEHKHHELYEFGRHLLERFFEHYAERGAVLVCELLFSKSAHDCYEIEYGYGSYDTRESKSKRSKSKCHRGKSTSPLVRTDLNDGGDIGEEPAQMVDEERDVQQPTATHEDNAELDAEARQLLLDDDDIFSFN